MNHSQSLVSKSLRSGCPSGHPSLAPTGSPTSSPSHEQSSRRSKPRRMYRFHLTIAPISRAVLILLHRAQSTWRLFRAHWSPPIAIGRMWSRIKECECCRPSAGWDFGISLWHRAHFPSCSSRMSRLISPTVGRSSFQYFALHAGPQQMVSRPGVNADRSRPQTGQALRARRSFSSGVLEYRRFSRMSIFCTE
jgi:hypothetical protein